MFYIAENYISDDLGNELGPTIAMLFGVADRGIRGALLQRTPLLALHMDDNALNTNVFGPMCSGFSDSSPALRELTLKSTLVLLPHLTAPNLEKLSRYLVRLQADPEPSIRTNTVIFFSKLAPHLTESSRQKMLQPAFSRAMKDTFAPCRLSALKCILLVKEFFSANQIADQIIPAVSPHLLDSDAQVRREAFLALDHFVLAVRQESERMLSMAPPAPAPGVVQPQSAAAVAPPPVAGSKPTPAPASGGWGLTSWMSSSTAAEPDAPASQSAAPVARHVPQPPPPVVPMAAPVPALASMTINDNSDGWGGGDGDGWGDESFSSAHLSSSNIIHTAPPFAAPKPAVAPPQHSLFNAPAEDDFFGGFDSNPPKPIMASKPRLTKGKLVVPGASKKPAKPAVTKLAVTDDLDDGWDDF
jgi:SCY1-like protein 1